MNEDNKNVECTECGYIHKWSDRTNVYDEEYSWTCHYCPKCGEESYYPVDEENQNINNMIK